MICYGALVLALCAMTLHRLGLAWAARHHRAPAVRVGAELPAVVVQLPLYNERRVVERLIDRVCELDYPENLLSIQVLDDSTDATSRLAQQRVAWWRERGKDIEYIHRDQRSGFKAGALAHGLARTDAPLVAVFDADFVPPPSFLRELVPHFDDPTVGMVQAAWGHLNRGSSVLTEVQAVLLDGHFYNEHAGRAARGCFFNFNGTAGIWRRQTIDSAGGWLARTITEDLDLSYRAQLAGWRFVYRPDVVVPAELPADMGAFKQQQHRWAKGAVQTARHLLPRVWRAPGLRLSQRLHATSHLLGNLTYPGVIVLALSMPAVTWARGMVGTWEARLVDAAGILLATGAVVAFYALALHRSGAGWKRAQHLPATLAWGVGLAINNTRAVWEALRGHASPFIRTPKTGDGAPAYAPEQRGRVQAALEVSLGLYVLVGLGLAVAGRHWGAVPFLALFAWGFLAVGLGTWWGGRGRGRERGREGAAATPRSLRRGESRSARSASI